jgi:iron-sulfur cluster repair protein YtfE (RIC family)
MPLKRHPALIPLSHDHQKGLLAANLIRSGAPRYPGLPNDLPGKRGYLWRYYQGNLRQHLRWEEEVLFPAVEELSSTLTEMVRVLRREHRELRAQFSDLPPAEAPELQAYFDALSQALQAHIRKEERQFFEDIQATMEESALEALGKRLRAFEPGQGL